MPSIVWKGHLTFGLISIPVKLYRAARRERIQLHYVHQSQLPEQSRSANLAGLKVVSQPARDPERGKLESASSPPQPAVSRVRQELVSSAGETPVSPAEALRGYQVEPDRYVVFTPGELKELRRRTSESMEILRSMAFSEIDPVFFETSYYVVPDRGGEKTYAVLFAAMRESGNAALAKVGMHGREHIVIIRPGQHGLIAHTMFYTDEIRFESEYRTDVQSVGAKELQLAQTFLQAIEGAFNADEFKDEYRAALKARIESKMARADVAATSQRAPEAGPVSDILEALQKSIEMMRKPAASEKQPAKGPGKIAEFKAKRHPRRSS